jgi:hypothetical protein
MRRKFRKLIGTQSAGTHALAKSSLNQLFSSLVFSSNCGMIWWLSASIFRRYPFPGEAERKSTNPHESFATKNDKQKDSQGTTPPCG